MVRLLTAVVLLFACLALAQAHRIEDHWTLNELYASPSAWAADAGSVDGQWVRLRACQGHLGESAEALRRCLEIQFTLQQRLEKLYMFASLQRDADPGSVSAEETQQKASALLNQFTQAAAYISAEVLEIGPDRLAGFLKQDPALAPYRHLLSGMQRQAPHILSAEAEDIAASFDPLTDLPESLFTAFRSTDFHHPSVRLSSGQEVVLDDAGYAHYRAAESRDDRRRVYEAFWAAHKRYEHTFGALLSGSLQKDAVEARVRHYADSLDAALAPSNTPPVVMQTMIEQANAHVPTLYRYLQLRAALLHVDHLHYYDLYAPLGSGDAKSPSEDVKHVLLEAFKPLGADYVARVKAAFEQHWIETSARPRRALPTYAVSVYGAHPFILLNQSDDDAPASALSRAFGQAINQQLSARAQPFVSAQPAPLVAEIAASVNEELLLEHLFRRAKSDDERVFALGLALESLRSTFFRQALFAEFERDVHATVDRGEPMTGEAMTHLYAGLLKKYYGDAEGMVHIDELDAVEWTSIPHFYSAFYTYQYATAAAAAAMFTEQILSEESGALTRYLKLLQAGQSDDPYVLVKAAGVDLATPWPYQVLAQRMNKLMDQIEQIEARHAGPLESAPRAGSSADAQG